MNYIEMLWRKIKPVLLDFFRQLWPILIQVAEQVIFDQLRNGKLDKDGVKIEIKLKLAEKNLSVKDEKINQAINHVLKEKEKVST